MEFHFKHFIINTLLEDFRLSIMGTDFDIPLKCNYFV